MATWWCTWWHWWNDESNYVDNNAVIWFMAQNASKWLTNTEYVCDLFGNLILSHAHLPTEKWQLTVAGFPTTHKSAKRTVQRCGKKTQKRIRWKNNKINLQSSNVFFHTPALYAVSWIPSRGTSRQMMALVAWCLSIPEGYEPSTSVGDTHVIHLSWGRTWLQLPQCGTWRWWRLQSMIYLLFQGLVFNTNVLFLRSNALVPCLLFHLCHLFFWWDFSPVLPVATCCLEGGNKIDSAKCSCGYQKILKSEFYCLLWIVFSNTSRSCG